jgi:hypothetical protein
VTRGACVGESDGASEQSPAHLEREAGEREHAGDEAEVADRLQRMGREAPPLT